MKNERNYTGFVCIDHTESPGFSEDVAKAGHRFSLVRHLGAGQKFQAATNTCSHCDAIVVRNPDRVRPRGHCSSCDYFICDGCAVIYHLTSECRARNKRIDNFLNKIAKGLG